MNTSPATASAQDIRDDYWSATCKPLHSLAFLAPLLIAYELGVLWVGGSRSATLRNGADAWMRDWLQQIGISGLWYLPLLLAAVLIGWHYSLKQSWRISWETLGGMLAESLLFAFMLILVGQTMQGAWKSSESSLMLSAGSPTMHGIAVRFVTFVGAGIYEEFLFRLCLVPLGYAVLRGLLVPRQWAVCGTVIATSLLFSLAHYLGPSPDGQSLALFSEAVQRVQVSQELWSGFIFRALAGAYFTLLFFFRGFGVTVGCHAAYDLIVGIVLVSEL